MMLEYTSGCICDSLSIDGVETIDMSIEDFKKVLYKLLAREQDLGALQSIFMDLMLSQGEYESSDKPCECCGDYISTCKLEI